ncbi:pilus assembly protein TadG-related protein [Halodesulfovibrio aestuarii]|uniref:Pilus assembly protein TadG-related protein n=1 Tax=Halodesulfovibrio aestuarii TaxID=126333 RepID=A0ABV4JPY5_9BACT
MRALYKLIRNERGAVGVIMALTLVVVIGFVAFGVDVGNLRAKRGFLQKAADIAALAGGHGLIEFGTDLDLVTQEAVSYGRANLKTDDVPASALQDTDVSYYLNGAPNTETPNQVEVVISRTTGRGNPLPTFFGPVLNVDDFDVTATSRVQVGTVCSTKCLKPFVAPDKFTFTDLDGDGVLSTRNQAEMDSIVVIGYSDTDFGTQVALKIGNAQDTIVPGQFNAVDLPPLNKATPVPGASIYRENIAGCSGSNADLAVEIGDELQLEPGNMVGPTRQGLAALVAQDPGASWDTATGRIINSAYPDAINSPRVAIIAFYDPTRPPQSGRNTVFVNYLAAVFVEDVQGQDVTGRFIRAMAVEPGSGGTGGDCLIYVLNFVRDSSR